MTLAGNRKLIVCLLIALGAFIAPVTPTQADVLKTILVVFVSGNAVEHIGKVFKK